MRRTRDRTQYSTSTSWRSPWRSTLAHVTRIIDSIYWSCKSDTYITHQSYITVCLYISLYYNSKVNYRLVFIFGFLTIWPAELRCSIVTRIFLPSFSSQPSQAASLQYGAKIWRKVRSTLWVGCTNVTDDRQTDNRQTELLCQKPNITYCSPKNWQLCSVWA